MGMCKYMCKKIISIIISICLLIASFPAEGLGRSFLAPPGDREFAESSIGFDSLNMAGSAVSLRGGESREDPPAGTGTLLSCLITGATLLLGRISTAMAGVFSDPNAITDPNESDRIRELPPSWLYVLIGIAFLIIFRRYLISGNKKENSPEKRDNSPALIKPLQKQFVSFGENRWYTCLIGPAIEEYGVAGYIFVYPLMMVLRILGKISKDNLKTINRGFMKIITTRKGKIKVYEKSMSGRSFIIGYRGVVVMIGGWIYYFSPIGRIVALITLSLVMGYTFVKEHPQGERGPPLVVTILVSCAIIFPYIFGFIPPDFSQFIPSIIISIFELISLNILWNCIWLISASIGIHSLVNIIQTIRGGPLSMLAFPGLLKNEHRHMPKVIAYIPFQYVSTYVNQRKMDLSDRRNLMQQLHGAGYSKRRSKRILSNFLKSIDEWVRIQKKYQGIVRISRDGFCLFKGRQYSFTYRSSERRSSKNSKLLWIALNVNLFDGSLEKGRGCLTKDQLRWLRIWLRIHEELHALGYFGQGLIVKQENIFSSLPKTAQDNLRIAFKKTEYPTIMLNYDYISELIKKERGGKRVIIAPLRRALVAFEQVLNRRTPNRLLEGSDAYDIDKSIIEKIYGPEAGIRIIRILEDAAARREISNYSLAAISSFLVNCHPDLPIGHDKGIRGIIHAFACAEKVRGFESLLENIINVQNKAYQEGMVREIVDCYYLTEKLESIRERYPKLMSMRVDITNEEGRPITDIDGILRMDGRPKGYYWLQISKNTKGFISKIKQMAEAYAQIKKSRYVYDVDAHFALKTKTGDVRKIAGFIFVVDKQNFASPESRQKFLENLEDAVKSIEDFKEAEVYLYCVPESDFFTVNDSGKDSSKITDGTTRTMRTVRSILKAH